MQRQIYLDHNATTPIDSVVAQAIFDTLQKQLLNPASQHQSGQAARRVMESARRRILQCLGADLRSFPADHLVFTSGGTEANNLAILGLAKRNQQLIISAVEHPSVLAAAEAAALKGASVHLLPVNSEGVCCLKSLVELLERGSTSLVSMMLVNNETGVIQPVSEAAKICHQFGVLMHTDAVQAVGKIPVQFAELGVDLLTLTPHKLYGPRGIGVLIHRPGIALQPILFGGFQQAGVRPGTEDPALAIGACLAIETAIANQAKHFQWLQHVRDQFLLALQSLLVGEFIINGAGATCSPHTLNISFPGVERQSLMIAADIAGIAFSTGSACASGSSEVSPVLLAMNTETSVSESAIRISFGKTNSVDEVEFAGAEIAKMVNGFRQ